MAKLGDKLEIGDRQYEILRLLEKPSAGLCLVEERYLDGAHHFSFYLADEIWDAAVRGRVPLPTDEGLAKLKADHEHYHWESCDRDEAANNYIEALEARDRSARVAALDLCDACSGEGDSCDDCPIHVAGLTVSTEPEGGADGQGR